MKGRLTTHVLDVSRGGPASGIKVQLWKLAPGGAAGTLIAEAQTNADGRLERPLLEGELFERGMYELLFFVGDYFRGAHNSAADAADAPEASGGVFLEQVPVRFRISDPEAHYHIPLLAAPGGYSTYRGS